MTSKDTVLLAIALVAIVALYTICGPIKQPLEYHEFIDDRTLFGIDNAHNVLSNVGFLIVGAWGTIFVLGKSGKRATGQLYAPYLAFFIGVLLTAFGSAYYHYDPNNQTLVWDRLPMTIMFMGFFASVIGELINPRGANRLLWPLLVIGLASVVWWTVTESKGAGDLRPYVLVQFLPYVLIVAMLFMYEPPREYLLFIVALVAFSVLAKLFEAYDKEVYRLLGAVVGGHALKHLAGAAGTASILVMLMRRRPAPEEP